MRSRDRRSEGLVVALGATTVLVAVGVVLTVRADDSLDRGVGMWVTLLALLVLARHRRNILVWVARLGG